MELLKPCSKADYPAYSVAFTGTAGNTDAWAAGPQGVLVWASQACYVEVGVGALPNRLRRCRLPVHRRPRRLGAAGARWQHEVDVMALSVRVQFDFSSILAIEK